MKQARTLDRVLTTDGMDVATVCQDILRDLPDVERLRFNAPDYVEVYDHRPGDGKPQLLNGLHRSLQQLATEVPARSEVVLANARASAELRQAMSNTRLQRIILTVSAAALLIAAFGLYDAGSSDGRSPEPGPSPSATATFQRTAPPTKPGAAIQPHPARATQPTKTSQPR